MTVRAPARRPRWRGLGLRARLTVSFGVGGLLLAALLAALTYTLARGYLIRQRETAAIRAARVNASAVATGLRSAGSDLPTLLDALGRRSESETFVLVGDDVFGSAVTATLSRLPDRFLDEVRSGHAVRQRFRPAGGPHLAIGIPLDEPDARYVEVFNLRELDRTLRTLSGALLAAAAVTSVGFAAVGWRVSGRVLNPVATVAEAAAAIAAGRLDTRLDVGHDRDLLPLAGSFNAMADALQRRIERDARFAADVSHELRSPLTTLATSVEILETHRRTMDGRAQQAVGLLSREMNRFVRLVEDLLEISRADVPSTFDFERVVLDELVRQAVRQSGRVVPVEPDPRGPVTVRADRRRIERVLTNLLDNAEQYGRGAIRVGLRHESGRVRIEVDDAGPGVPAGEHERIFDRFSRGGAGADRVRAHGVGLGLALAAEHVRAHGGRIWVEDRPGGGARFVVELPVSDR